MVGKNVLEEKFKKIENILSEEKEKKENKTNKTIINLEKALDITTKYVEFLKNKKKLKNLKSLKLYEASIITKQGNKTTLYFIEKILQNNNKRYLTLNKGYTEKADNYIPYLQKNKKLISQKLIREW